jgi:diaminopimelate epimerase
MRDKTESGLPFVKMHGLGNDFVVIDGRSAAVEITPELARALGDRHRGVGFDQLALMDDAPGSDLGLRFWNADGSESSTCGNATRCIARAEMDRTGRAGARHPHERGGSRPRMRDGLTAVNMGAPRAFGTRSARSRMDTLAPIERGAPRRPPWATPLHLLRRTRGRGPRRLARHEHTPLFPQRTNVQVVQVSRRPARMRVWERGTGITLASGSVLLRRAWPRRGGGLLGERSRVVLDGRAADRLERRRRLDDGPTAHVFSGSLTPAFLEAFA